jgi:hypothetical protein
MTEPEKTEDLSETHIEREALLKRLVISSSTLNHLVRKGFPKSDRTVGKSLGRKEFWKLEDVKFWLDAADRQKANGSTFRGAGVRK